MSSRSTYEQDQELFADTLLKVQVHSALAKEHVHNQKSPLPLLAQSCSLLDNLPLTSPHWTDTQRNLISALKIDAWIALSDACIESKDLIQAEASLQRLSDLQDTAAGPLSLRASKKRKPDRQNRNNSGVQAAAEHASSPTSDSSILGAKSKSSEIKANKDNKLPSSSSAPSPCPITSDMMDITEENRKAATDLIQTWDELRQVYEDMGKVNMANNFTQRIEKMRERLQNLAAMTRHGE